MIGKQLAKEIRNTRAKVYVTFNSATDSHMVVAEKSDLIAWCNQMGDNETGMKLVGSNEESWMLMPI